MTTPVKPKDEIVVRFFKDHAGNIGLCFYDCHGVYVDEAVKADIPTTAKGKEAGKRFAAIKSLAEKYGLKAHSFYTKSGQYFSYRLPVAQ